MAAESAFDGPSCSHGRFPRLALLRRLMLGTIELLSVDCVCVSARLPAQKETASRSTPCLFHILTILADRVELQSFQRSELDGYISQGGALLRSTHQFQSESLVV